MAILNDFDINTVATPKPWGAREEQCIRDIIQTLTEDTISGVKNTAGHKHGKLYDSGDNVLIDTVTSSVITLNDHVAIGSNYLSNDGTNMGLEFGSTFVAVANYLRFYNVADTLIAASNYPYIYGTSTGGGSYPFNEGGNLILQSKSTEERDILLVTGTTPAIRMTILGNGNVGIGTTAPASLLTISGGNILVDNNREIRFFDSGATARTAVYMDSSNNLNIGTSNGALNFIAGSGTYTTRMSISTSGNVYMNNISSSAGDADLRYNTSTKEVTYDTSALKYKENIRKNPSTEWLYNLPIVFYDRKDKSKIDEIGIIADDLEKIKPEYCCYNSDGEIESYNKSDLVPVLIAEIQKHEKRINNLEKIYLTKG